MNRPFLIPLALALLSLASCATPPTPEEMKAAHYGAYPSEYRSTIEPLLESRHEQVGDPFELVSMSRPQKDWSGDSSRRTWGYSVIVVYKAPNPVVNAPTYIYREKFFFVNGKVVSTSNVTNLGDVLGSSIQNNLDSANQQLSGSDSDDGGDDSVSVPAPRKKKK